MKEYGINLAVSTIRILQKEGVRGFHLCTLNLEKSVKRVLEILEWVTPATVAEAAARRQVSIQAVTLEDQFADPS